MVAITFLGLDKLEWPWYPRTRWIF